MPTVRKIRRRQPNPILDPTDDVVAIACSDIHLSLKPPIARAGEEDWFEAMLRPWSQVMSLRLAYGAPIICAGDIFDRWNSPPELINWALTKMPRGIHAIPGNHDLPFHRREGVARSAYGTLVRTGLIKPLTSLGRRWTRSDGVTISIYGFPFSCFVTAPIDPKQFNIAVIHEYMWTSRNDSHVGASKKARLTRDCRRFEGYNVVIVGDNHIGFSKQLVNGTTVFNCGTFMRRKSNEVPYHPRVGLIHRSGKVTSWELDISKDVITELVKDDPPDEIDLSIFIEELGKLGASHLNYRDAMIAAMSRVDVSGQVRKAIMEALG